MNNYLTPNTITPVTRKEIIDRLDDWPGDLNELEFLQRLYDLNSLPSTDGRSDYRKDASADIWQHRVNNRDWGGSEWVFTDPRFNIQGCDDEEFLRFLCETLHPLVRSETEQVSRMLAIYNEFLKIDGWELYTAKQMSQKPIFGFRRMAQEGRHFLEQAEAVAERLDEYVANQVRRLRESIDTDPELAIGTAKEFLEALCKRILIDRHVNGSKAEDLQALVKLTINNLSLTPCVLGQAPEEAIRSLIKNLVAIVHQIAVLRNLYGTGHGKGPNHVGVEKRHVRLVVGSVITLGEFLWASHETSPLR